jgi:hypothetical protein
METTYQIVPRRGIYRVEAVAPNGTHRVVRTWRTEEAAISHLRTLRAWAAAAGNTTHPGERDWRGK